MNVVGLFIMLEAFKVVSARSTLVVLRQDLDFTFTDRADLKHRPPGDVSIEIHHLWFTHIPMPEVVVVVFHKFFLDSESILGPARGQLNTRLP